MNQMNRRSALALLSSAGLAPAVAAQTSPAASAQAGNPPSLGNLFAGIESYAQTVEPRLSFLDSQFTDLEKWKAAARQAYRNALGYHPDPGKLEPRTLARHPRQGYFQEDIVFHTTPFAEVSAALLLPEKPLPAKPAIVALHDHGGFYYFGKEKMLENDAEAPRLTAFKQQLYDGFAFAADYARAGYVVLAIDAFYFGSRRLNPETLPAARTASLLNLRPGSTEYIDTYNKLAGSYEDLTAKTIFLAGSTWPGILVWDDMRSVDFLQSRPEVNPDRIGCVGLSLGGLRALRLGGLDPRIRSTVVCCFMSTAPAMLRNDVQHHTWMLYTPLLAGILDLPDVVSMTAPNWLLVQYGRKDPLFPAQGKTASADKLSRIFRKANAPDRFKPAFWDVPHMFSKKMQDEALEWFNRSLA